MRVEQGEATDDVVAVVLVGLAAPTHPRAQNPAQ